MELYELKIKVMHVWAYQPDNCIEATATRLFWDRRNMRIVVELLYDNGAIDWIPLDELGKEGYPKGYQTLCMNCQWIKREDNKECGGHP